MRRLFAALLLLAGCSSNPVYYPTLQEQVISLRKGDLENAGIAFITPSTVTGQEQEKEAVALTFTDVLKRERPGAQGGHARRDARRGQPGRPCGHLQTHVRGVRATPDFSRRRRCGGSAPQPGRAISAQIKLQAFNQSAKNRFGLLGLRLVETQYADVRLFFQIWDARDGSIAWEAMQELRISRESTTEEPVMLRKILEHSARDLVAKLP